MRTLRLSLAGTVILVLLVVMAGAAVAQDEEPAANLDWVASATFSGTSECMVTGFGEQVDTGPTFERRGFVSECTGSTSDPRASGTTTIAWDNDCYAGIGCVGWGTFALAGPEGTWEGSFTVSTVGSGENIVDMSVSVGRGTGAYEGWTYIEYGTYTGTGGLQTGTVDGFIYLGDPPPLWDVPAE